MKTMKRGQSTYIKLFTSDMTCPRSRLKQIIFSCTDGVGFVLHSKKLEDPEKINKKCKNLDAHKVDKRSYGLRLPNIKQIKE